MALINILKTQEGVNYIFDMLHLIWNAPTETLILMEL